MDTLENKDILISKFLYHFVPLFLYFFVFLYSFTDRLPFFEGVVKKSQVNDASLII